MNTKMKKKREKEWERINARLLEAVSILLIGSSYGAYLESPILGIILAIIGGWLWIWR